MANMAEELSKRLMAKAEASWEQNGISDQERQVRRREIAKTHESAQSMRIS
jgi:phosphohistidine phosphatase SixA